ncbi:hypothetical protein GGR58DRAFT_501042 [Xylaria digitata]|nr:hypothetical protein GGR58DRAFT_501042 [Xylaria digitata]
MSPVPCEGCLASALSGHSDGVCYDASGLGNLGRVTVTDAPPGTSAVRFPFALRLLAALAKPVKKQSFSDIGNFCAAIRVAMTIPEDEFARAFGAAPAAPPAFPTAPADFAATAAAVPAPAPLSGAPAGAREQLFRIISDFANIAATIT